MGDTYFRRDGNQIIGSDGSTGYDEGNRLVIEGKTYYKEGNKRYFCPDDGKTYLVDDGHISTLEDGIIGTYDSYGSRINSKTNSRGSISSTTHNYQKKNKIDEKSAMGYYYLWECVKNHIIAVLVFWGIFGGIFVGIGTIFENAYLGFFLGLIVSIAISIGIEKAVKSFYELIRFGKIKGKLFLIVGVLSLLFFLISCYSILEEKEIIEENKQHIIEDPSYSKYANERIEIAENNKDMAVICSISSVVVAVISGGIFVLRNQSKK